MIERARHTRRALQLALRGARPAQIEKSRKRCPLIRQCLDSPAPIFKDTPYSRVRSHGTDRAKLFGNASGPWRQNWTIIHFDPRWYSGGIFLFSPCNLPLP
jgi:hypothetical protein